MSVLICSSWNEPARFATLTTSLSVKIPSGLLSSAITRQLILLEAIESSASATNAPGGTVITCPEIICLIFILWNLLDMSARVPSLACFCFITGPRFRREI